MKRLLEIPSSVEGTVEKIQVKVGDKVSEGMPILTLKIADEEQEATKKEEQPTEKTKQEEIASYQEAYEPAKAPQEAISKISDEVHAGPGVRRMAENLESI